MKRYILRLSRPPTILGVDDWDNLHWVFLKTPQMSHKKIPEEYESIEFEMSAVLAFVTLKIARRGNGVSLLRYRELLTDPMTANEELLLSDLRLSKQKMRKLFANLGNPLPYLDLIFKLSLRSLCDFELRPTSGKSLLRPTLDGFTYEIYLPDDEVIPLPSSQRFELIELC